MEVVIIGKRHLALRDVVDPAVGLGARSSQSERKRTVMGVSADVESAEPVRIYTRTEEPRLRYGWQLFDRLSELLDSDTDAEYMLDTFSSWSEMFRTSNRPVIRRLDQLNTRERRTVQIIQALNQTPYKNVRALLQEALLQPAREEGYFFLTINEEDVRMIIRRPVGKRRSD